MSLLKTTKMPLFVVQEHSASHHHFDFRLEINGVLKSWALPKVPPLNSGIKRLAIPVVDHHLSYGTFQGTIPEGQYGAGQVTIWDHGTYQSLNRESMSTAYQKGKVKIELHGKKLKGAFVLIKAKSASLSGKSDNWLFMKTTQGAL